MEYVVRYKERTSGEQKDIIFSCLYSAVVIAREAAHTMSGFSGGNETHYRVYDKPKDGDERLHFACGYTGGKYSEFAYSRLVDALNMGILGEDIKQAQKTWKTLFTAKATRIREYGESIQYHRDVANSISHKARSKEKKDKKIAFETKVWQLSKELVAFEEDFEKWVQAHPYPKGETK